MKREAWTPRGKKSNWEGGRGKMREEKYESNKIERNLVAFSDRHYFFQTPMQEIGSSRWPRGIRHGCRTDAETEKKNPEDD